MLYIRISRHFPPFKTRTKRGFRLFSMASPLLSVPSLLCSLQTSIRPTSLCCLSSFDFLSYSHAAFLMIQGLCCYASRHLAWSQRISFLAGRSQEVNSWMEAGKLLPDFFLFCCFCFLLRFLLRFPLCCSSSPLVSGDPSVVVPPCSNWLSFSSSTPSSSR